MMRTCLSVLAVLLCGVSFSAQELSVNGTPGDIQVPRGDQMEILLTGPAGQTHFWGFDLDPGPTTLGSFTVNLGFSANLLDIGQGLPFPASGERLLNFGVGDPGLIGITIYSTAAFVDTMGQVFITNGISFKITPSDASAGPDADALVGESVTLDGSGMLDTTGQLNSGVMPIWTIIDAPVGSTAIITDDQTAFPSIISDLPGTYRIKVETPASGSLSVDELNIHAHDLNFSAITHNQFTTGSVSLAGTSSGPTDASLEVNGTSVPLTGGTFDAGTAALGDPVETMVASLTFPSGQTLGRSVTINNGMGSTLGTIADMGAAIRLNSDLLSPLEPPVEAVLAALPLNAVVTAIPTIPVLNSPPLLTVDMTFTGASFDPAVDLQFLPSTTGIGASMTFTNLLITADMTGTIFGVPFTEVATISADAAVTTTTIITGLDSSGQTEVTSQGTATTFTNFQFAVTGLLGGLTQLGAIQAGAETAIAAALDGLVTLIPQVLNPLLQQLALSIDLSASGIPVSVQLPISCLIYDGAGITLCNHVSSMPLAMPAGGTSITEARTTPGILPGFSGTAPTTGLPYLLGIGVNDDLLNQVLAASAAAGALDLEFTNVAGIPLTAESLATLLPGLGFENLPASMPARMTTTSTAAPVITMDSTAQAMQLDYSNLRLTFGVETSPGQFADLVGITATSSSDFILTTDPMTGQLSVSLGTPLVATSIHSLFPSATNPDLTAVSTIVEQLLPILVGPINNLVLSVGGLGGNTLVEAGVDAGSSDTFVSYLSL